jgi:eukaryotic-like serine/threonine-protein kinase
MGIVYLASDQTLPRKVALKLLRHGATDDPGHRVRLEREAAAAAKCQHPNLVQIFEIGEYQGELYLALEYVEGETLAKFMAGEPQAARDAAALAEKLARAVDYVHRQGVIHRDLKPANVLLTTAGEPKIADFGLARLDDSSTRTEEGTLVGTLAYMAPEQASSRSGDVGAATDIHAVGAILYEALTGRPPYRGDTAEKTLQKILFDDVVRPSSFQPETPRDLEAICLKCLEKAPSHRYETAVELAEDLRRYLDGKPTVARPVKLWERSWRWCRRNPKLAAVSAALAATILLAASAFTGLTYRHNLRLRDEISRTQARAAEARRSYQEASSTIQSMIDLVENPRLEGVPRLVELRRDQREASLAFYERILNNVQANAGNSGDPVVMMDTIREFGFAATLEHKLGRSDRADNHLKKAIGLIENLRKKPPDVTEFLAIETETLMKRGTILGVLGARDLSTASLLSAIESAEKLIRLAPDDLRWQELCAMCYNTYGNSMYGSGRNTEALRYYHKSTIIRESIDPARLPGVTPRLAESIMNEGVMLWGQLKITQAQQKFQNAEKILLSIRPEERFSQGSGDSALGMLYMNWSGMLHLTGHFQEAIAQADAGLSRVEPHLKTEPNDADARDLCLRLHGNRAYALADLEKHNESADEWDRVLKLSPEPVPEAYRVRLAIELVKTGKLDRALEQVRLVKSAQGLSGNDCYNLGCLYALVAAAVRKDQSMSIAERDRLVESHISDAMRWLNSAAVAGIFGDAGMRDYAPNDPDLAILADRSEFRKLIEAEAAKSTKKGKGK